jgi:organic hydroperoxide reductase OsmC/OhrA
MGLGFNGGELLALAIGGCFCNDMQAISEEIGVAIADLRVSVSVDFAGAPSRATGATMTVECVLENGADPSDLVRRAKALTTISNSLREGFPVAIEQAAAA